MAVFYARHNIDLKGDGLTSNDDHKWDMANRIRRTLVVELFDPVL